MDIIFILIPSTENSITKDKICEKVIPLLVHYNLVNNDHQQNSKVLCTFVPNKLFGQLLEIARISLIFNI